MQLLLAGFHITIVLSFITYERELVLIKSARKMALSLGAWVRKRPSQRWPYWDITFLQRVSSSAMYRLNVMFKAE